MVVTPTHPMVFVCVCVRERERESGRESERERGDRNKKKSCGLGGLNTLSLNVRGDNVLRQDWTFVLLWLI